MKLGLGLYRHMLNKEHYRFAKQAGCSHIVVHLVDYYKKNSILPSTNEKSNYGFAEENDEIWEYKNLVALRKEIEAEGLKLEAIENFSPGDWYDILLDGPKKEEQMENLKRIIRNVGKAGIPVLGYNFSIAGVWGHTQERIARGGALTVRFNEENAKKEAPILKGQIWNMTYDETITSETIPPISHKELWQRVEYFLKEIIPVAEEAGVRMALHPDDPPMPVLRGHARLVYQSQLYQKILDIVPSKFNALEFCMGSIQEMTEGNIYEAIDQYSKQGDIAYIHFRNVVGKVPNYKEVFVDEGDIDMIKALRILKKNNFDGVLIPDHTPQMDCDAPWHAGMAYALGYMKAAMRIVNEE